MACAGITPPARCCGTTARLVLRQAQASDRLRPFDRLRANEVASDGLRPFDKLRANEVAKFRPFDRLRANGVAPDRLRMNG